VTSLRSCWKLPLRLIEPIPAISKMDPLLTKAKPISDGGSTSGLKYLRRGKKTLQCNSRQKRGVRLCERNSPADTKVSEGGGEGAPGMRAEIPLQPMMKTMVRPCSLWRSVVEQISTCSAWKTPHRSRWMPEGGFNPMGSPRWSRLLAGPVAP